MLNRSCFACVTLSVHTAPCALQAENGRHDFNLPFWRQLFVGARDTLRRFRQLVAAPGRTQQQGLKRDVENF